MGTELMKADPRTALSVRNANAIERILQPLIREIFLTETYIAGAEEAGCAGNAGMSLTLRRTDGEFDPYAICVLDAQGNRLGFLPEKDTPVLARLMDAGKQLTAKVTGRVPVNEYSVEIRVGISLVDI